MDKRYFVLWGCCKEVRGGWRSVRSPGREGESFASRAAAEARAYEREAAGDWVVGPVELLVRPDGLVDLYDAETLAIELSAELDRCDHLA